jgi:hypothetical protein
MKLVIKLEEKRRGTITMSQVQRVKATLPCGTVALPKSFSAAYNAGNPVEGVHGISLKHLYPAEVSNGRAEEFRPRKYVSSKWWTTDERELDLP